MRKIVVCLIGASMVFGAHAVTFAGKSDIFGCGTVVSVRDVVQAPMNDSEYQRYASETSNTGQTFVQILGGTAVGVVVGAAAGVVTDVLIDSNRKEIPAVVEPKDGWKHVKALKIKIDDGREINLPLIDDGGNYKAGQRYLLGYSKQLDNIQLVFKGAHVPEKDDSTRYQNYCKLRIDQAVADDIIERSKSLVDESKVIDKDSKATIAVI